MSNEKKRSKKNTPNPFGGAASVFEGVAGSIRAGDSVEMAMKLYGLAWANATHDAREIVAVSLTEVALRHLERHEYATATILLRQAVSTLNKRQQFKREVIQRTTALPIASAGSY